MELADRMAPADTLVSGRVGLAGLAPSRTPTGSTARATSRAVFLVTTLFPFY